ncbi:MAG TPA: spore germination protein GerW family protein [Methanospirillum sp.]|nr:spore germination protein GerW family protein [Methanospirillum sp.]
MPVEEMLKEAAGQLKEMITARNVIGEAVDLGNRMIIPVTRFGLGFGAGGGNGSEGSGAGGGGGIEPIAVIITDKQISGVEGIQIVSLRNKGQASEVITAISESLVPQVIDLIKKKDSTKSTGETISKEPASP